MAGWCDACLLIHSIVKKRVKMICPIIRNLQGRERKFVPSLLPIYGTVRHGLSDFIARRVIILIGTAKEGKIKIAS